MNLFANSFIFKVKHGQVLLSLVVVYWFSSVFHRQIISFFAIYHMHHVLLGQEEGGEGYLNTSYFHTLGDIISDVAGIVQVWRGG